jgi:hypothetical protein
MSVLLVLITVVTLMLPAPTLRVASTVPATMGTTEMESHAQVRSSAIMLFGTPAREIIKGFEETTIANHL